MQRLYTRHTLSCWLPPPRAPFVSKFITLVDIDYTDGGYTKSAVDTLHRRSIYYIGGGYTISSADISYRPSIILYRNNTYQDFSGCIILTVDVLNRQSIYYIDDRYIYIDDRYTIYRYNMIYIDIVAILYRYI